MKVLVVGNTSTIAGAVAQRIREFSEVKFAGRNGADFALDLALPASLPRISERFDLVVSAAADFGGNSPDDFIRAEIVNSAGALAVCALAEQVGAGRVVLISSVFASYSRNDPYYGIYALSKRHGEEAAALFCSERGLQLTTLRPTQVYDAEGACRRHQELLYAIADKAQAGQDIGLYGSNDARRNYLFLDDLAEICSRVIHQGITGTFTVAHPNDVTLSDVAGAAFGAFGQGGAIRLLPDQPDIPDLPVQEPSDLYELIDYRPAIDIRKGMQAIAQHRSQT